MADDVGHVDSPERTRNPSPPPELRNTDLLEADAISNTTFSKHWLFSTLMKLIEEVEKDSEEGEDEPEFGLDVDEELQNELCKLWDISMNMDICALIDLFWDCCHNLSVQVLHQWDWITAVSESEGILNNIIFILTSSTNCDLLKNAGEVIDILLDQREDLCDAWATSQFVTALMEAIKQLGCHHSEALELYFHIFQTFSTTEKGVETLVMCSGELEVPLMKYLGVLCEDEIVGLDGHEAILASTLSVLNILFLSDNSVHDKLTSNENLIRIFIKILEPLSPLVHMSRPSSSSPKSSQTSSSSSSSPSQTEEKGENLHHNQNGDHNMKCGDSSGDTGGSNKAEQKPQSSSYSVESATKDCDVSSSKHSVLYNIIKGFLYDVLCSLAEREDRTVEKILVYFNSSCSRVRLKYLIYIMREMPTSPMCVLDWLSDAASDHKQERLTRIIGDVLSGRNLDRTRSDSGTLQESLGQ
ncbi:protein saal1-like [Argopecten irradians]|uniref:protein saal1-like n=1 Tax=Argopecten irradians TaxID=31199 RepID=UPI00372178FF